MTCIWYLYVFTKISHKSRRMTHAHNRSHTNTHTHTVCRWGYPILNLELERFGFVTLWLRHFAGHLCLAGWFKRLVASRGEIDFAMILTNFQGKTLHTHTKCGRLNTLTLGDWAGRRAVGSVRLASFTNWYTRKAVEQQIFIYNSI